MKSKCEPNDGDLISKLPQSVICHIMSRLPSRDAVRTSILSKDWENKWTSIYNIDISDRKRSSKERTNYTSFINFVERILRLSHDLKGFRLVCWDKYNSNHLAAWVSTALKRNVETFELELYDQEGFVLPRSLLNNTTSLRKLKLMRSCTFEVPLENYFPRLTHLYLDQVKILNELSNSGPLVFTFPVLKTFELIHCEWSNVNLVEIYSPALSTFKCEMDCDAGVHGYSIKICGARLAKFKYCGAFPENIIFYESVVLSATFEHELDSESDKEDNDFQSGLQVRKQLKEFSSLTELNLSASICEAIAQSIQEVPLPQYGRLQRLVMYVQGHAKLLFELLHCAPSLRFLEITGWCWKDIACDEVDPVPYCVITHLQEVKIYSTRDKSLMHLAELFLKNGVKLRKVSLDGYYSPKVKTVEQLLEVPRASACIAIVSN